MGLFSSVVKSISKVVKSVVKVVENGVMHTFKSVTHMIKSIGNVAVNIYKGLEKATLVTFRTLVNPIIGLPSDIVRLINKSFNTRSESIRFRDFERDLSLVGNISLVPIKQFRDMHEMQRIFEIEKFVIPTLIQSQNMTTYSKANALDKTNKTLLNFTKKPVGAMTDIEVRDSYYMYEKDWSIATMRIANSNRWGHYNLGVGLKISDELVLVNSSVTPPIYDWILKYEAPFISQLPPKLDGQWYPVFDPRYFYYYDKVSDSSWIEPQKVVTDRSITFTIRLYASGPKTGSTRMFKMREARYIKEVN